MNTPTPTPTPSSPPPAIRFFIITIVSLFFIGILGLMLYGVKRSGDPQRDVLPSQLIGKHAPELALPSLEDPARIVRSSDFAGKPYIVNVWGSWCFACRDEHPVLTQFAKTHHIPLVGYNYKDNPDDAKRWLQQFGNPYTVVGTDLEGRQAMDWGIAGAPETFLIDGNGIVRWKYIGPLTETVINNQLLPELLKAEYAR